MDGVDGVDGMDGMDGMDAMDGVDGMDGMDGMDPIIIGGRLGVNVCVTELIEGLLPNESDLQAVGSQNAPLGA